MSEHSELFSLPDFRPLAPGTPEGLRPSCVGAVLQPFLCLLSLAKQRKYVAAGLPPAGLIEARKEDTTTNRSRNKTQKKSPSPSRQNPPLKLRINKLLHFIRLISLHQLRQPNLLLILLPHSDQASIRTLPILHHQAIPHRMQTRLRRIVRIHRRRIQIIQGTWQLRRIDFDELPLLRILDNIDRRRVDSSQWINPRTQLDHAMFLQQQQDSAFVGRIIRDADLRADRDVVQAAILLRVNRHRPDEGTPGAVEFVTPRLDLRIQEGTMLEAVGIQFAGIKGGVGLDVVVELDDLDFVAGIAAFKNAFYHFKNLRMRTAGDANFQGLVLRHSSRRNPNCNARQQHTCQQTVKKSRHESSLNSANLSAAADEQNESFVA